MRFSNIANLTSRLAFGVMVMIVGCGPDERPSPEEDAADPNELAARAASELERRRTANDCTPWSWRPCQVFWKDSHGQQHCPRSTEVCRPGGRGWFPCGMYQLDDAGVPRFDGLETTGPQADAGSD